MAVAMTGPGAADPRWDNPDFVALRAADREANRLNSKGWVIALSLRTVQQVQSTWGGMALLRPFCVVVRGLYVLLVNWILGVDIPPEAKVGGGLRVYHGQGLVVHRNARIGRNVTLRQNTTIGVREDDYSAPTIEDSVDVGANAVIIGAITIGARSRVGAGAVVIHDVPPDSVVVGNPARILG